jgi:NTP pyrophosphatase (non-canonical NTP hydrolase)
LSVTESRPGEALLRLVAVMDTLRVSCPWDARQTHESLAPHLLEECYEALDALESGDPAALRDELGDVLLQVVFHARIAAEATDGTGYTIDDVAEGIVAKLIRRHPHVFADVTVSGPEEVKRNWDAIKAAERVEAGGAPGSVLDTVPFGQPALSLADQIQRRAERAGAPADLALSARESGPATENGPAGESESARESGPVTGSGSARESGPVTGNGPAAGDGFAGGASADEGDGPAEGQAVSAIGAELFALVARAREAGLDPELELRAAARAYRDRVRAWELSERG